MWIKNNKNYTKELLYNNLYIVFISFRLQIYDMTTLLIFVFCIYFQIHRTLNYIITTIYLHIITIDIDY